MNQKSEEVARLNAVELINNLFSELNERERDILTRRFGLHGKDKETLENIGSVHSLTRERIRQIETSSIKKLQQLTNLDEYIANLKNVIVTLLEEHGGLMEKDYLLDLLVNFSVYGDSASGSDDIVHKSYLNFMISKLLHKEFEDVSGTKNFLSSFKLKFQPVDHLDDVLSELVKGLEDAENIHTTDEIIGKLRGSENYKKHQDKLNTPNNVDISSALPGDMYEDHYKLINENKPLFSVLKAAKKVDQNKFGYWGISDWREIKPKTINDKIGLILSYYKKPMHFVEIADEINKVGFDKKKANPATVHNELILDSKYVLVGRGMYGLKDWGYKRGAVADVIEGIMKENGSPLSRENIIDEVLKKRIVKKTTIVLALMNKDKFAKVENKYFLKKA